MLLRKAIMQPLSLLGARLQAEWDRMALWLPVFIGIGIGIYFALPQEPGWIAATVPAALTLPLFLAFRKTFWLRLFLAAATAAAIGFLAAFINTNVAAAPIIVRDLGPRMVTGRIVEVFAHSDGVMRAVLADVTIDRLPAADTPERVRISVRKGLDDVRPGDWISVRASIGPPPQPVAPGAYDFGRAAFYNRIGGFGYAVGSAEAITALGEESLWTRAMGAITSFRFDVSERIRNAMDERTGTIAAALISGDRSGIDKNDLSAMRDSSLQHLLSISGLHMAIVGLGLFVILRLGAMLFGPRAQEYPVKKIAAAFALLGSFFYLLLSGAEAPSQRSFFMIGLMFVAIMLDRPAITMRTVAISAVLLLLGAPESLIDPSFQMSYAAVIALVAAFEVMAERRRNNPTTMRASEGVIRRLALYVALSAVTSLVAGTMTAPFAAFHFNRIATYGLAANLLAAPLVSFVIMPAGVIAMILMPFGGEGLALPVMGWGIERLLDIAYWVQSWPGSASVTPSWPLAALILFVGGALWLCLWRTGWRAFGTLPMAASLVVAALAVSPDILINAEGTNIAARGADGRLYVARARSGKFAAEMWLRRDGDDPDETRDEGSAASAPVFACDRVGCFGIAYGGDGASNLTIALIREPEAALDDCTRARIVVSAERLDRFCDARYLFDYWKLRDSGAVAIRISNGEPLIETVAQERGDRPWSRPRTRTGNQ